MKNKRGQVSIETLMLATIVIMLSLAVFAHYLQIMDTTTAMQAVKLETLKQIEQTDKQHTIEKIEYQIGDTGPTITFCITTKPAGTNQMTLEDTPIIKKVAELTAFEEADISISHNDATPCT